MRILFDQGRPVPLRRFLQGHEIRTAFRMGRAALKNGDLISAAEGEFDLVITTDKHWKHQQRITGRAIAILVLPTANWPQLKTRVDDIVRAVRGAEPGNYIEL